MIQFVKGLLFVPILTISAVHGAEALFTREGSDPGFAALLADGTLKPGQRFAKISVPGSQIKINSALLEKQTGKINPIPQNIGLHTQNSGGIHRRDFSKWTRWYQEDQNTQIFRLFKDEQNIRDGAGEKGSPGRIESYSLPIIVAPGAWHEWEGTFTIIDPVGANIFQLFHDGHLWPFHIRMNDKGDIYFARRRPAPGLPQRITLAENMTGKSLSIKVRANGHQYEVFMKAPLEPEWKPVTHGSFLKAKNNKISFRWGMYCGSKKGETIRKDALMLVNNVVIR